MHGSGGGVTLSLAVDGPDVDPATEPQFPGRPANFVGVSDHEGFGGGGADRVTQLFGGDVDSGRGIAGAGCVDADEGVEVNDAAALELGHLGEVDRDVVAQSP